MSFADTLLGLDEIPSSKLLLIGLQAYAIDGYLCPQDIKIFIPAIEKEFGSWKEFKEQIKKFHSRYTMIGNKRLDNIKYCIEQCIINNIEGDIIECGVWRGGAMMYTKKCLQEFSSKKTIFLADSFCGLPEPTYAEDINLRYCDSLYLSVSLQETLDNFNKFNLLDNVIPIVGWFKDTLPLFNNKLSIIRLDGDLYESTMDSLINLYPLLSNNGFIIIDDYHIVNACKLAVDTYIDKHNLNVKIIPIDRDAVYWQKREDSN